MTRLEFLINFVKAAEIFEKSAAENNLTTSEIKNLRALDPEFDAVAHSIVELFTGSAAVAETTTATTTTTTTTETPTTTTTTTATATPIEVEIVEETVNVDTTTEQPTEMWKQHPDLKGVELSTLGHVRVNGKDVEPRMIGGYMKFYVGPGKVYALAAAVLTTFSCHTDNSMVPVYKDGNKENCCLSNLHWGLRECTISASAVERACRLIAENPRLSENELLNLLVREKTIRSVTALRSILAGNWRTISDRYFVVRGGSIHPTTTTTATTTEATATETTESEAEPEVDDSGNLKGILALTNDPAFVRKLYSERVDAKRVSAEDQVALILSYVMDGKDSAPEIQRAIRKDFGRRVMISNSEIQKIIG